jgi:hypothetical protein
MAFHRQMQQWHWISAALCLAALLLFSFTGVTLNHAGAIGAKPEVTTGAAPVPAGLLGNLPEEGSGPVPSRLAEWIESSLGVDAAGREAEWSADEIYVSAPGPGRDAWVSIDRASGEAKYEVTSRGWLSYLNDLHKGRNTGAVWRLFIDVVAVACLVFSVTGIGLLWLAARQRRSTWPTVGAGVGLLVLLAVFFAH